MTAAAPAPRRIHAARAIVVASIGNALEWYDLIVFGFLSAVVSRQFFPKGDPAGALLLTLATFGLAFVVRPLGGLVLGRYADRAGRMKALTLGATLMMVGTGMIAFLPTYGAIGVLAPLGLVLARLLQGFSAGGEFASATAFLAEQSHERRGFFASWQISSQGITTILGSATGALLFGLMSPQTLDSWGWRIPFALGMLIGPVALYIRLKVPETAEFAAIEPEAAPLRATWRLHKRGIGIGAGVSVLATVTNYVILFIPTFASSQLGIPAKDAFIATLATGFIQFSLAPVVGWISDRVGRPPIMIGAAVTMLIAILPLYAWLVAHPTAQTLLVVQVVFGVIATSYFACQPAFLSDLFPAEVRGTGMSLAYNAAATLFGGFAPFVISLLIQATGSKLAPSFYVMLAAVLSLTALAAFRAQSEARRQPAPTKPIRQTRVDR